MQGGSLFPCNKILPMSIDASVVYVIKTAMNKKNNVLLILMKEQLLKRALGVQTGIVPSSIPSFIYWTRPSKRFLPQIQFSFLTSQSCLRWPSELVYKRNLQSFTLSFEALLTTLPNCSFNPERMRDDVCPWGGDPQDPGGSWASTTPLSLCFRHGASPLLPLYHVIVILNPPNM